MTWEDPRLRIDSLALMASREEVEAGDITLALHSLRKLLEPVQANRFRQRVLFGINGYDDDPRELYQVPEVRAWFRRLDAEWPYWFFFLTVEERSTLPLVAFALCNYHRVSGGAVIDSRDMQHFLLDHYQAMNDLCRRLGVPQVENDDISRKVGQFFMAGLKPVP